MSMSETGKVKWNEMASQALKKSQVLRVGVCTPNGEMYKIQLDVDAIVKQLREKIHFWSGIKAEWQSLYFNGYFIDNDSIKVSDLFDEVKPSPPPYLKLFVVFPPITWPEALRDKDLDTDREAFVVSKDPEGSLVTSIVQRDTSTTVNLHDEIFLLVYLSGRYQRNLPRIYVAKSFRCKAGKVKIKIKEEPDGYNKRLWLQQSGCADLTEKEPYAECLHREELATETSLTRTSNSMERLTNFNMFLRNLLSPKNWQILPGEWQRLQEEYCESGYGSDRDSLASTYLQQLEKTETTSRAVTEIISTLKELELKRELLVDGDYEKFGKMMNCEEIRIGRILALVRFLDHRYGHTSTDPVIGSQAQHRLVSKADKPERDFAYIHSAVIYVGEGPDGKHYIIENAGGPNTREEGAWLKLSDLKSCFSGLLFDEAKLLVLRPDKPHATAQRAMAAYFHQFKYQFHGFGFNCEAFASACAGLYENYGELNSIVERASNISLDDPFQRVAQEKKDSTSVRRTAIEHAANQRLHTVHALKSLFLENQPKIDMEAYALGFDKTTGKVCIVLKTDEQMDPSLLEAFQKAENLKTSLKKMMDISPTVVPPRTRAVFERATVHLNSVRGKPLPGVDKLVVMVRDMEQSKEVLNDKLNILKPYFDLEVEYIGYKEDDKLAGILKRAKMSNNTKYIFYFGYCDKKDYNLTWAVDMALLINAPTDNQDEATTIKCYVKGECVCHDVFGDLIQKRNLDNMGHNPVVEKEIDMKVNLFFTNCKAIRELLAYLKLKQIKLHEEAILEEVLVKHRNDILIKNLGQLATHLETSTQPLDGVHWMLQHKWESFIVADFLSNHMLLAQSEAQRNGGKITFQFAIDVILKAKLEAEYFINRLYFSQLSVAEVEKGFYKIWRSNLLEKELEALHKINAKDKWPKTVVEQIDSLFSLRKIEKVGAVVLEICRMSKCKIHDKELLEELVNSMDDAFKKRQLSEISRILELGKQLTTWKEKDVACLEVFVQCEKLVNWVRRDIRGETEVKVFVDVASISIQEADMEMRLIVSFHKALIGYGPLLFDITTSCSLADVVRACEGTFKNLKHEENLPASLIEIDRELDWFKNFMID